MRGTCISNVPGASYEASTWGWDREMKRRELSQDKMQYLLLLERDLEEAEENSLAGTLFAFAALVPDSDEADAKGRTRPITYLYELQVRESLRGLGLGSMLLGQVEAMARSEPSGPELIMLTCFTANEGAVRFYRDRHGFIIDEISPEPDRSDYLILGKPLD